MPAQGGALTNPGVSRTTTRTMTVHRTATATAARTSKASVRLDVVVEPEDVLRVQPPLDGNEPLPALVSVGRSHSVRRLVDRGVVHVAAAAQRGRLEHRGDA